MHFCTQEEFEILKKRTDSFNLEEFIDPDILSLVKVFNKVQGITTVWCCSGHEFEKDENGDDKGPNLSDRWYIAFVARPEAAVFVSYICSKISDMNVHDYSYLKPNLKITKLMGLGLGIKSLFYNVLSLDGVIMFKDVSKTHSFWKSIEKDIEDYFLTANDERFALEA